MAFNINSNLFSNYENNNIKYTIIFLSGDKLKYQIKMYSHIYHLNIYST